MPVFVPPAETIVHLSEHWLVNHRVDAWLPGYLMVGGRDEQALSLPSCSQQALRELGPLLARVVGAVEERLAPEHVYVCRFGHEADHTVHFHVIPVYPWLKDAYEADPRYDDPKPDGDDYTQFVCRELCGDERPPFCEGPTVEEAIQSLRQGIKG